MSLTASSEFRTSSPVKAQTPKLLGSAFLPLNADVLSNDLATRRPVTADGSASSCRIRFPLRLQRTVKSGSATRSLKSDFTRRCLNTRARVISHSLRHDLGTVLPDRWHCFNSGGSLITPEEGVTVIVLSYDSSSIV